MNGNKVASYSYPAPVFRGPASACSSNAGGGDSPTNFGGRGNGNDGSYDPTPSRREREEREEMSFDPFTTWVDEHPWTVGYVAIVVTLILILQVVDTFL